MHHRSRWTYPHGPFMAIPHYDHPKWKNVQNPILCSCLYVLCPWLIIPILALFANRTPCLAFPKMDPFSISNKNNMSYTVMNYVEKDVYVKMMNVAKQMDRHYNRVDIRYLSAGLPFWNYTNVSKSDTK